MYYWLQQNHQAGLNEIILGRRTIQIGAGITILPAGNAVLDAVQILE
jgi:hypothetical protein